MTRVVEPGATQEFCDKKDVDVWQCLFWIMQIPTLQPATVKGKFIHANGAWWTRVEERQTDEPSSLSGQLGGLFADGPTTPSQDCSFVCGEFEWTTTHPIPQAASEATFHHVTRHPLGTLSHSQKKLSQELSGAAGSTMHFLKWRSTREESCSVECQIK